MKQQFGLSQRQYAELLSILKQFPAIESAIIFGSRAKGTMHERSDIDLAVTGKALDRHKLAELMLAFDDSDLPFQVDIQLLSDIQNPTLLEHISRVGKVIYP
jgi:predicted nucleotidyltransferase